MKPLRLQPVRFGKTSTSRRMQRSGDWMRKDVWGPVCFRNLVTSCNLVTNCNLVTMWPAGLTPSTCVTGTAQRGLVWKSSGGCLRRLLAFYKQDTRMIKQKQLHFTRGEFYRRSVHSGGLSGGGNIVILSFEMIFRWEGSTFHKLVPWTANELSNKVSFAVELAQPFKAMTVRFTSPGRLYVC